jgi:hypothetical protein
MKESQVAHRCSTQLGPVGPAASMVLITILTWTVALALTSAGGARTSGEADPTRIASPAASSVRTAFYDRSGKFLCAVFREPGGFWAVEHSYGELGINYDAARRLEAHFTHHFDGWARRVAPSRWNVVAAPLEGGPYEPYGRIVRRTRNRWTYYASGHVLGYTLGPDGPAAATAALIFWWHDNARQC